MLLIISVQYFKLVSKKCLQLDWKLKGIISFVVSCTKVHLRKSSEKIPAKRFGQVQLAQKRNIHVPPLSVNLISEP